MNAINERAKAVRAARRLTLYLDGCLCCEIWTWSPEHIEKLAARIASAVRAYSSDSETVGRHKAARMRNANDH